MDDLFIDEASGSDSKGNSEMPRLSPTMPLAARMRPRDLSEYVGQSHILGEGKLLRRAIEADRFTSLIFYGPPGSVKPASPN
jgi:putative ATPase